MVVVTQSTTRASAGQKHHIGENHEGCLPVACRASEEGPRYRPGTEWSPVRRLVTTQMERFMLLKPIKVEGNRGGGLGGRLRRSASSTRRPIISC